MEYCIIITTCPTNKEAGDMASRLVKEKLAACVQLSPITSYYIWNNKPHSDSEIRLIIKTRQGLYSLVEEFIKQNHSYDLPQIVQVPVKDGSKEYLEWIDKNTRN